MEKDRIIRIAIGILIFVFFVAIQVILTLSPNESSNKSSKMSPIRIAATIIVSALIAYFSTALFSYIGIFKKLFPEDNTTTISYTAEPSFSITNTKNEGESSSKIKHTDNDDISTSTEIFHISSTSIETSYTEKPKTTKEETTTKIDLSVKLSCKSTPLTFTDKNAEINAFTSFDAKKVIIICETENKNYGSWSMTTQNLRNWSFDACFYEANTYTITAKAYIDEINYVSDSITVTYPF